MLNGGLFAFAICIGQSQEYNKNARGSLEAAGIWEQEQAHRLISDTGTPMLFWSVWCDQGKYLDKKYKMTSNGGMVWQDIVWFGGLLYSFSSHNIY